MTKKLENASGNLKEILCAIADGEVVQYEINEKWVDWCNGSYKTPLIFLSLKWRKKPDAFEEVYTKFVQGRFPAVYNIGKLDAKHFWDAAMEHKDDD